MGHACAELCLQENLILEVIKLGIKYDMILHQEAIQYPPDQEKMKLIFGEGSDCSMIHAHTPWEVPSSLL